MRPPIKKLAVFFLIGSIVTSSLALGISALINPSPSNYAQRNDLDGNQSGFTSPESYRIYGAGPNGENLTEEVISLFARRLVAANPEGPQVKDGLIQLFSPSNSDVFAYLDSNPPSKELLAASLDESRIKVLNDYDDGDVSRYLSVITEVQSDLTLVSTRQAGVSGLIDMDADAWTSSKEKALGAALDKLYEVEVPAPVLDFHKSALSFFSTTASFSSIMFHDPVAAIALSKDLEILIAKQNVEINKAFEDLVKNFPEIVAGLPSDGQGSLTNLLGIQTAFAAAAEDPTAVPAKDRVLTWETVVNWLKEFWEQYKDEVKAYALGFLKNKLIEKISEKIVKWAQGEGVPGYVTNWLVYQADAALSAKFGMISRETAKVCGNAATEGLYGDILASALGASTYQTGTTGVDQTVGETPGCPSVSSGFYRGNNGYNAEHYLTSLTYNTWNDLINIKDRSIRAAGAASQAAVNEALAGRGSLDVKKCDDGSAADNEGRCSDGSRVRTITQASTKQDIVSKTVGATIDTITAVNNQDTYSAIVEILTNAVLNYLWTEGEGLFQNSGTEGPPPPPVGSSLETLLAWYESQLQTALTFTNSAVSKYSDAVDTLRASLPNCGQDVEEQILDSIQGFESAKATFTNEAARIQNLINIVQSFKENPSAHTQQELESQVGTTSSITLLVTQARSDSARAETDTKDAITLFQSCRP